MPLYLHNWGLSIKMSRCKSASVYRSGIIFHFQITFTRDVKLFSIRFSFFFLKHKPTYPRLKQNIKTQTKIRTIDMQTHNDRQHLKFEAIDFDISHVQECSVHTLSAILLLLYTNDDVVRFPSYGEYVSPMTSSQWSQDSYKRLEVYYFKERGDNIYIRYKLMKR